MAETRFEIEASALARAVANSAKRERNRAVKALVDRADIEMAEGHLQTASVLLELVETLTSAATAAGTELQAAPPPAPSEPEAIEEPVDPDDLPPVHHLDDFAEGQALVQGGMFRRAVVGYQGANGHLRD